MSGVSIIELGEAVSDQLAATAAGCSALTPRLVGAWVAGAQPGAVMIYAVGFHAETHAAPGVAEELRGIEALGHVYLTQQRVPNGPLLYRAQRSSRPLTDPKNAVARSRYVRSAV